MNQKYNSEQDLIGYKPFKTSLPKKKNTKPKKPKKLKFGQQYDPTPEDFGKIYNPMDENPSGVFESFERLVLKYMKTQSEIKYSRR
jgi:hypothetical protein